MHPPQRSGAACAFATVVLACGASLLPAQDPTDSLRKALSTAQADTGRVTTLNALASAFSQTAPDSTIAYATRAAELAGRIGAQAGAAEARKNIGYGYMQRGEYGIARVYFQRSMDGWSALGRTDKLVDLHHLLGHTWQQESDFPEALKQHLAELRLVEARGDRNATADVKGIIGTLHDQMGDSVAAEHWQLESLAAYEKLGDSLGMAKTCNNLGTVYDGHGRYAEGLKYLDRALAIARRIGHPMGEAICLASIANHYQRMGDLEQALERDQAVIALFEKLGDVFDLAAAHINTGEILTSLQRYDEAKAHLNKGIELAKGVGAKQWLMNGHAGLYDVANAEGDAAEGLKHFKLHIAYRDSIENEANTRKAVQSQMQYDFEKKEAATRAEQEKKDQRQRMVRNGIGGGLAFALLFLGVVWRQRNKISAARKRSDELLLNILPEEVAEELKDTGSAQARHFDTATILFTDFKGFTQLSEQVTPAELVAELNSCFKVFDGIMEKYRIEKIKTIGDAYMAAGGLPDPQHGSATDVVRAALEMQDFMRRHKAEREAAGKPYFEMRVGIHTGPVVAGIVGVKKFQYDIWGDTVNTASRMESSGEVGQVNISEATYALVKDEPGLRFTPRGKVQAKGKGELEMYFVQPG